MIRHPSPRPSPPWGERETKFVALTCVVFAGCMTQAWATPQPYFKTTQPAGAWTRVIQATTQHCNGVSSTNEAAGVVLGAWEQWNTPDGLVLTQCLVTLLNGDEHVRDVRITFAVRRCPLPDMSDVQELLKTCEVSDSVPDQVRTALQLKGEQMEKDINSVR